jgi:hypothetical protein
MGHESLLAVGFDPDDGRLSPLEQRVEELHLAEALSAIRYRRCTTFAVIKRA